MDVSPHDAKLFNDTSHCTMSKVPKDTQNMKLVNEINVFNFHSSYFLIISSKIVFINSALTGFGTISSN